MTDPIDKEAFVEELEVVEEDLNDLILDLINLADISFQDEQEFKAAKKFLKHKLHQSVLYLVVRLHRSRTFDTDINK